MNKCNRWQVMFNDSILNEKNGGPVFVGARRNGRGEWKRNVPEHVAQFLELKPVQGMIDTFVTTAAANCAELHTITKGNPQVHIQKRTSAGYQALVYIEDPPKPQKPRNIPRSVPAIRSLQDLCDHFCADTPQSLNRRLYKDTACGASISVQTPDGAWHHCGDDWSEITEIKAFTLQTIVEGSDTTVDSDEFTLPVTVVEIDTWMEEMEAQAQELWEEANAEYEEEV